MNGGEFFPYKKSHYSSHDDTYSGIPDHFSIISDTDGLTNQDVLETLMKQENLLFQPANKYSCSNGAYVLLSLIVAQISGISKCL